MYLIQSIKWKDVSKGTVYYQGRKTQFDYFQEKGVQWSFPITLSRILK